MCYVGVAICQNLAKICAFQCMDYKDYDNSCGRTRTNEGLDVPGMMARELWKLVMGARSVPYKAVGNSSVIRRRQGLSWHTAGWEGHLTTAIHITKAQML